MMNVRLSVKLMGGFLAATVSTLIVGLVGLNGVHHLHENVKELGEVHMPSIQNIMTIEESLQLVRMAARTLMNPTLDDESRKRQTSNIAKIRENYKKAWNAFDLIPKSKEEEALWKQLGTSWTAMRQANDEFFRLASELEKTDVTNPFALRINMETFRGDHYKLLNQTSNALRTKALFEAGEDHTQCGFGKWLAGFKTDNGKITETLKEAAPFHQAFHQSVKKIKGLVKDGDTEGAALVYTKEMVPAEEEVFRRFDVLREQAGIAEGLYAKMDDQIMRVAREKEKEPLEILAKLVQLNQDEAEEAKKDSDNDSGRAKTFAIAGMIAGTLICILLGGVLTAMITRPLKRVIEGLTDGSDQVAAASGQVASASQQLAEGASEQAAAIEETSSSLEEMSSMTRQNADNADNANAVMTETSKVVDEATLSMTELTRSMSDISAASEQTQKIIKTIDEIAFQTNLLALNAAVEAARAGEAGAGFAVVADEVRNLAMRAAEAAKNTSNLIEETVKSIKGGSEVVFKTNEAFGKVTEGAQKAGSLIAEIAAASREQALGIEQLNKAVSEMDKVTQQNAASAEESASASGQMNAQASQMKVFVGDLVALVGGKETGAVKGSKGSKEPRRESRPVVQERTGFLGRSTPKLPVPSGKGNGHGNGEGTASYSKGPKEVPASQVIPFDDDDFKSF